MPQRSRGAGDGFSAVAAPDSTPAAQPIDEKIIDPRTQDLVEQLRLYLEAMQTWAQVLRAATWVASLAGTGSTMSTHKGGLCKGCSRSSPSTSRCNAGRRGDDETFCRGPVRRRRCALVVPAAVAGSFVARQKSAALFRVDTGIRAGPHLFSQRLSRSPRLRGDYPHQLFRLLSDLLGCARRRRSRSGSGLRWGPRLRTNPAERVPAAPARSPSGEVSALDLIDTTRYGAVRCCTGAAVDPSICQWSRILPSTVAGYYCAAGAACR